jgi:hypothetical protein
LQKDDALDSVQQRLQRFKKAIGTNAVYAMSPKAFNQIEIGSTNGQVKNPDALLKSRGAEKHFNLFAAATAAEQNNFRRIGECAGLGRSRKWKGKRSRHEESVA